jgi:hypothetical protein
VKWEGAIVTQDLYGQELLNAKYLPVVFSAENRSHIPGLLRGATFYDLSANDGYEQLYRRLTNQPEVAKEELGSLLTLPTRKVRWQTPEAKASRVGATIRFRTDLIPDEVSVYEALPAIARGDPVAITWPQFSDDLYEKLVATRPDLRQGLLERGHVPGERLVTAIEQFDRALRAGRLRRDEAAARIPLMWAGMAEWWVHADAFRRALHRFLALVNIKALLNLGSVQFEGDYWPLPGDLQLNPLNSELFQTPSVAEVFEGELPFWAADVGIAGEALYVFAPRPLVQKAYMEGVAKAGPFLRDFLVPQVENSLIGQQKTIIYRPEDLTIYKIRDESFEEACPFDE